MLVQVEAPVQALTIEHLFCTIREASLGELRTMGRKRGAPFGNQNAHKHGFYSAAFRQNEQRVLADSNPTDLADEISLVRVAIARCLEALESNSQERDIETELAILRTINLGALSINSLVRTGLMLARGFGSLPAGLMPPDSSDPHEAAGKDGADHEPV